MRTADLGAAILDIFFGLKLLNLSEALNSSFKFIDYILLIMTTSSLLTDSSILELSSSILSFFFFSIFSFIYWKTSLLSLNVFRFSTKSKILFS